MEDIQSAEIAHAHYAGFWLRFIAVCIDLILCTPIYFGIRYLFDFICIYLFGIKPIEAGIDFPGAPPSQPHEIYLWWFESFFAVAMLGSYVWFFSSKWQASPGMYFLKFRITDVEGKRIGFGRGLYWLLTSLIIWLICFAGIAYLQSKFDLWGIAQLEMSCIQQVITVEDCQQEIESAMNISLVSFQGLVKASLGLFIFLAFIWALSIALPKDKTGFHNLICGTRFLKGRP